ncbi:glutathione peroxidase [Pseudoalteromonas sp. KJ71-7]|uniref:glutathione peroxidase n=1 Tax=unclassified Pseudoalteromonas TaxID=194690 RepID=UPI0039AF58E2|nr:glutathione peroxidase [Ningiella sp. W23]
MHPFHQLKTTSLQGQPIDFKEFEGKVVLIVNTASECGLTYQYESLQALHEKYASQGLVIIGFPCNQFGQQEPGDAKQIAQGCLINYGVNFLVAEKVNVNGQHTDSVFRYLKSVLPGFLTRKIKWNFTKFLVAADGTPIKRFAPITKPEKLEKVIEKALLAAKA